MILVTGGAGFIGANFVLDWLAASQEPVAMTSSPRHCAVAGRGSSWWRGYVPFQPSSSLIFYVEADRLEAGGFNLVMDIKILYL